MWLNTQLNPQPAIEQAHIAKVIHTTPRTINTTSHLNTINVQVISPIGMQAMPTIGDDVVLIPTMEGKYLCLGKVLDDLPADEVRLTAQSGAFIHLKADGSISLNGLIISKEGKLNAN